LRLVLRLVLRLSTVTLCAAEPDMALRAERAEPGGEANVVPGERKSDGLMPLPRGEQRMGGGGGKARQSCGRKVGVLGKGREGAS